MKRIISVFLLLCLALLTACGGMNLPPFDYEAERAACADKSEDDGVYRDYFENTAVVFLKSGSQARSRAEVEVDIDYDTADVYYDDSAEYFKVVFYNQNGEGERETVYMNSYGLTTLIVYD